MNISFEGNAIQPFTLGDNDLTWPQGSGQGKGGRSEAGKQECGSAPAGVGGGVRPPPPPAPPPARPASPYHPLLGGGDASAPHRQLSRDPVRSALLTSRPLPVSVLCQLPGSALSTFCTFTPLSCSLLFLASPLCLAPGTLSGGPPNGSEGRPGRPPVSPAGLLLAGTAWQLLPRSHRGCPPSLRLHPVPPTSTPAGPAV